MSTVAHLEIPKMLRWGLPYFKHTCLLRDIVSLFGTTSSTRVPIIQGTIPKVDAHGSPLKSFGGGGMASEPCRLCTWDLLSQVLSRPVRGLLEPSKECTGFLAQAKPNVAGWQTNSLCFCNFYVGAILDRRF